VLVVTASPVIPFNVCINDAITKPLSSVRLARNGAPAVPALVASWLSNFP